MKVNLNWLKDFVDIDLSPQELGRVLTMIGLEVEGLDQVGHALGDIVVAKILSVSPHPSADRLSLCRVDTGRDQVQVVCGASNAREGVSAPLALPGSVLPDGTVIQKSRIRGETSVGMLLAEDEMGLTDDHSGILQLPPDVSPGSPVTSVLPLADWVFDVSITPNRPDCACVLGIAREIAAATGKALKKPKIEMAEEGPPIETLTSVTLLDPIGCPRYAAGVIQGIHIGASPFWIRYRLQLCGVRSINNVVDATNYVMLELNQPLHAFDYSRLRENRIVVRRANTGEVFTTLDGETRTLNSETLMICDGERSVALAGIMGGLNSEIFAGTENVLVESACFDPVTIRRGAKRLGLTTEASYRFERGADIGGVTGALKRSLSLISDFTGGKIATGIIDNYPKPFRAPVIDLRVDKTNRLLSRDFPRDEISRYLKVLEMEVRDLNENEFRVTPPSFRVDITREVDLMEEVARLGGYDNIPVTYPHIRPSEVGEIPELPIRDHMRSVMVGQGFTEIITYSFISPASIEALGVDEGSPLGLFVKLLNPLTVDQSVMRTSLVPGLLGTVKSNMLHEERNLKLFEWGKCFIRREDDPLPLEKNFLAAVMTGAFYPKTWCREERSVDFYDIKGAAEVVLKYTGLSEPVFKRAREIPGYDAELCSSIYWSGVRIGSVGRVSPKAMNAYDLLKAEAYLFELDIEAVLQHLPGPTKFHSFGKYPAVYRDLSIIVKRQMESARVVEIIKKSGGELVESVRIFDVYEGRSLDPSEKALAFKVCYRSKKGTLDGGEVNRLHESIIDEIRKDTGGRLREG